MTNRKLARKQGEQNIVKHIFVLILILLLAVAIGMMVGYSLVGHGGNPFEVFRPSLWSEVFRFIF